LVNPTFQLTPSGKLITYTIVESQILPSDVLYFPLDSNAKDKYGTVSPSSELNTIYENGAVWVGKGTTNYVKNPTGANNPRPYTTSWDAILHLDALEVDNWMPGYNSGVPSSGVGYHAKWVYEGMDRDPCMKFIDRNDQFNLGHRWLGIFQSLGTPSSLGWAVGDKITISWYQKTNVLGKGADVGIYHYLLSTGSMSFSGSIMGIYVSSTHRWERVSFTFTIDSDWDLNKDCVLYVYGRAGDYGVLWVDNVQIQKEEILKPFVVGSIGDGKLEFNFYRDYGLDWSKDWSIVYWKKPIGTHTNDLSGYNIESIGCNSNSVGGGYRWWGKNNGSNAYSVSGMWSQSFSPTDYFGKWEMVSIVKQGNTITWKFWREKDVITFQQTVSISTPNYFVTQYGYDFKLGGWDNVNPPNTYYRDLIVAKRALSDAELNAIARTQMRAYVGKLQIQGSLLENQTLR